MVGAPAATSRSSWRLVLTAAVGPERRRNRREGGRLGADVQELIDLILQAAAAERGCARRVEGVETERAIVASAECAADCEVGLAHVQDLRQTVDIVGAAREAAGRIDGQRLRVGIAELEGIALVGVAVAERGDGVDALGRGGRRDRGDGKRGCAKQDTAKQSAVRHESLSPRPDRRPPAAFMAALPAPLQVAARQQLFP